MKNVNRLDSLSLVMGIVFSIIWSSAFTSARILVSSAPPLMILSVRFMISGLLGMALARARGQKIQLDREEWYAVAIIGVCQNALYLGLNFLAMQWIGAGVAAILASLLPLIVAAVSWVFLGERTSLTGILGLTAGFAGVLVIMLDKVSESSRLLGLVFCLIGVFALAGATMLVSRISGKNRNLLMVVGMQMIVGSVTLFPFSLFLETWVIDWSWSLVIAFCYTTLMPGLFATLIWFLLVGRIGPVRASTFHFLNPFFGVFIAAIILAEPLSVSDGIGVVIIMAGIFAVQLSRRSQEVGDQNRGSKNSEEGGMKA